MFTLKPKTPTVDQVLSAFHQTIDALDGIVEAQTDRAGELVDQISQLKEERNNALAEAGRASLVAEKLREVLS